MYVILYALIPPQKGVTPSDLMAELIAKFEAVS